MCNTWQVRLPLPLRRRRGHRRGGVSEQPGRIACLPPLSTVAGEKGKEECGRLMRDGSLAFICYMYQFNIVEQILSFYAIVNTTTQILIKVDKND